MGYSACQASATEGKSGTRASVSSTVTVSPCWRTWTRNSMRRGVVRAGRREPGADAGLRARSRRRAGERAELARAPATDCGAAAGISLPPSPPARRRRSRRRDLLSPPACAVCGHRAGRRLAPRLSAARLIAHGDEQRRDVLAVLARLGERGAGAIRLNALGRQIDADGVGLGVGALDPALRARFGDLHVLDDAPPRVVEPAQERSSTEQTAKSAVAERREGIGDGGRQGESRSPRGARTSQEERREDEGDSR